MKNSILLIILFSLFMFQGCREPQPEIEEIIAKTTLENSTRYGAVNLTDGAKNSWCRKGSAPQELDPNIKI